jgi:hypothetical protein
VSCDPCRQLIDRRTADWESSLYVKVADPAHEPTTYTFSAGSAGRLGLGIVRIRGAHLADPVDAVAGLSRPRPLNDDLYPAPSVDVSGESRLVLRFWGTEGIGQLTLPADLTRKNMELFAREVMPALKARI